MTDVMVVLQLISKLYSHRYFIIPLCYQNEYESMDNVVLLLTSYSVIVIIMRKLQYPKIILRDQPFD